MTPPEVRIRQLRTKYDLKRHYCRLRQYVIIFCKCSYCWGVTSCKVRPRTDHKDPEEEQRYTSTLSLTLALLCLGRQHHAAAILPGERSGTHCIGGLVGPRAGLDRYGKPRPHRKFQPRLIRPVLVAILTEVWRPTLLCVLGTRHVREVEV